MCSYLSYHKGIGKFSMRKDLVCQHLMNLCNQDDLLAAILMSGSEQLYSQEGSILLKSTENEFCLKDNLGLGEALNRASQMRCLPLKQLDAGNFNFDCVKSFEKKLLKTCCVVFQNFFLSLKVTESYLNYESMKDEFGEGPNDGNSDVNPDDGEGPDEAEQAVIQESLAEVN
jgi:hypothetical protein